MRDSGEDRFRTLQKPKTPGCGDLGLERLTLGLHACEPCGGPPPQPHLSKGAQRVGFSVKKGGQKDQGHSTEGQPDREGKDPPREPLPQGTSSSGSPPERAHSVEERLSSANSTAPGRTLFRFLLVDLRHIPRPSPRDPRRLAETECGIATNVDPSEQSCMAAPILSAGAFY